MRVLQVSDGYPPAVGGMERTVQGLARELAGRGHRTEVATLSAGPATVDQEGGVTVRRIQGWTRHLRRFSADPGHQFHPTVPDPQLIRRLQEVIEDLRPDIVHAHGWILNSCLSLRLPKGSALVATLHDYGLSCAKKTLIHRDELDIRCAGPHLRTCLGCATDFYGLVKGVPLTLGLAQSRRRLDRVDMFLPISLSVAQAGLPGVAAGRSQIIPPFVADEVAEHADLPRPDFLPAGDFVVFVGALGEHKGIGVLVQAHQQMTTSVPLVVFGSSPAAGPAPQGTPGRPVTVHVGVPHAQIMAALAVSALAVVPSRWAEPFGLVAVEAMAAGVPVVASRVGALSEVVLDGRTGLLVEPGDVAGLARALDRLLDDPDLRAEMGRSGAQRARQYSASTVIPMVLNAYRDVLQQVS